MAVPLLATTLWVANAYSADVTFGVEAGVGESDNIRRTPNNEVSETIGTVGLDFSILQNTRRVQADVSADLAYNDYLHNTYDGEVIGNFEGNVDLRIVPEHFDWIFSDNFGQVASDVFAPVTPDNRENVNYFTTGPDFTAHFSSQTGMRLSAQYSKVNYESSPLDSNRYSGSAALFHDLSAASSLSANVQSEKIDFSDAPAGSNYDKQELYGRYDLKGGRTQAGIDLGYNRLNPSTGSDHNGWLARVDLARRASASSTFTATLGHEFSDAGNSFRQQQGFATALDTQTGAQTPNPFTSEYVTLGWDFNRERTGFGIGLGFYDESYVDQKTLDDTRTMANAHFSRALGPALQLQVTGSYSKYDFKNTAGDYNELDASILLTWRLGRRLWLTFQYEHFDRNGDVGAGEFTENREWIRLRYGDAANHQRPRFTDQPQNRPQT
jgi:hypothetical protein